MRTISDGNARLQALQNGDIDGYDLVAPGDLAGLQSDGFTIQQRAAFNILYLGMNQAVPDLVAGWSDNVETYDYDPELARKMLADAGESDLTLTFNYLVFQDPMSSLDPRPSVESILPEPLRAHGADGGRSAWAARVREMLEVVGMPASAAAKYPHEFSGGQRQRIGIARAMMLRPELIVADEPVSALDVFVQAQVINLLEELQDSLGLTYVVIAHDLAVVRHISDTIGVMYLCLLVEEAPSDDLYSSPMHPYTLSLMSAIPVPDPEVEDRRERILLVGDLPSPASPPSGCFHTRCPFRQPTRCDDEVPALREVAPGHRVACHYAEDVRDGRIAASASSHDPTASGEAVDPSRPGAASS